MRYALVLILVLFLISSTLQQGGIFAASSQGAPETLTISDFPDPFVASNGLLNCTFVVPSSSGHGSTGARSTRGAKIVLYTFVYPSYEKARYYLQALTARSDCRVYSFQGRYRFLQHNHKITKIHKR